MRRSRSFVPAAALFVAVVVFDGAPSAALKARSNDGPTDATCAWEIVRTPDRNAPEMGNMLRDVAMVSADDAWAVGASYEPEESGRSRSVILHWDGSRWRSVSHPQRSVGELLAIDAVSTTDVWAVGIARRQTRGAILHWDGTSWSRIRTEDPGTRFWHFEDVVAFGAEDVWAVGNTAGGGVFSALIEHWDGQRWSVVASPAGALEGQGSVQSLNAVGGSGPDDVWTVGWVAPVPTSAPWHTLIEHWDGEAWTIVSSPDAPGPRTVNYLLSVSAGAPDDAWAVGLVTRVPSFFGRADRQLLLHWDGSSWTVVPGAVLRGTGVLYDVEASFPEEAWAVGSTTPPTGPSQVLIERWDGAGWERASTPVVTSSWLSGIEATSSTDLWTVGSRGDRHQRSLALRCISFAQRS